MANRYCSRCGREVIAGKSFCGGCGQSMPAAAEPAPDEAGPAAPVCGQCGAALVPGKRFCRQCGNPVGEGAAAANPSQGPGSAAASETTPAAEPTGPVCRQCGAELTPGKRFCKQCGLPVDAPAASPVEAVPTEPVAQTVSQPSDEAQAPETPAFDSEVFDAPPPAPVPVELLETVAGEAAPMAAGYAPTVEMEVPYREPFPQEALPVSEWAPVQETVPPPAAFSAVPPAFEPLPVPGDRPKAKIGLAIAIAAVVLVAAGGGWAWYAYSHRPVSSAAKPSAETEQSQAQPPAQEPASSAPGTTVQPAKPPAGSPEVTVPGAPRTPPQPAPAPSPAPAPPIQPRSSSQSSHGNPTAPTPEFRAPPAAKTAPFPAQPAQPHAAVLHYHGPPVAHGGTVVFDNLPKARLKFTFDHAAWQLIIKTNPDGTKKVILSSLLQGYQSSCDLGWEIVE